MIEVVLMVTGAGTILTMIIVIVAALVFAVKDIFWKAKWRIHVVKFLAESKKPKGD